jgi:hypothetical protein
MTNAQMQFEAARLYHRIEVQCDLSRTTFDRVRLHTSGTRDANKLRLLAIKQDLIADANKIRVWATKSERTELEKVVARSYYRNIAALLDRCNGLLVVCGYEQKEI